MTRGSSSPCLQRVGECNRPARPLLRAKGSRDTVLTASGRRSWRGTASEAATASWLDLAGVWFGLASLRACEFIQSDTQAEL